MKSMRMFQCGRDSTYNKGTILDSSRLAMTLNIHNALLKSVIPKYIEGFVLYLDYVNIATMQQ
jgi:hypothetical protein